MAGPKFAEDLLTSQDSAWGKKECLKPLVAIRYQQVKVPGGIPFASNGASQLFAAWASLRFGLQVCGTHGLHIADLNILLAGKWPLPPRTLDLLSRQKGTSVMSNCRAKN